MNPPCLFLQGAPRSGKTTLLRRIAEELESRSIAVQGFFTTEVKEKGKRIGFDAICLGAQVQAKLARISPIGSKGPRVGKYHVYLDEFEQFLHDCLERTLTSDTREAVIIIDEIGKMECLSSQFQALVHSLFTRAPVLASIPVSPLPLVRELQKNYHPAVLQIRVETREQVYRKVSQWIQREYKKWRTQ